MPDKRERFAIDGWVKTTRGKIRDVLAQATEKGKGLTFNEIDTVSRHLDGLKESHEVKVTEAVKDPDGRARYYLTQKSGPYFRELYESHLEAARIAAGSYEIVTGQQITSHATPGAIDTTISEVNAARNRKN
jgi:hypothetical protein